MKCFVLITRLVVLYNFISYNYNMFLLSKKQTLRRVSMQQTFNEKEIEKFSALASQWWDPNGKFKVLHQFNEARIDFIKNTIRKEFLNTEFSEINVLDIGCGGGILSEALCKMGLNVTAIDASEKSVQAAKIHAENNNLNIEYIVSTYQDFLNTSKKKFDIVFAMEIIEHVDDQQSFVSEISYSIKEKGLFFLSTINRNIQSLFLAKFAAEYLLKWLPKNTHQYNKFVTTSEMQTFLNNNHMELIATRGINFNILKKKWILSKNSNVNYICYARKYK